MKIKKALLLIIFIAIASISRSETEDSLSSLVECSRLDKYAKTELYQMTYVGVPLIIGGVIVKGEDTHFRDMRQEYLPKFKNSIDNYIQYSPYAVLMGLKLSGVKGRSSWKRMFLSQAFSSSIMFVTVQGIKHTSHEKRPDGSDNNSFPSGHTAGAYTLATTTGLMRVANNKHWLSDVMTGAGIGIISTELGYYIADLICKDKGLNKTPKFSENMLSNRFDIPSFLGLHVGINIPMSNYDIDKKTHLSMSLGKTAGIEGAYFFNRNFGAGGEFTFSSNNFIANDAITATDKFNSRIFGLGGYFSIPISNMWRFGGKVLGEAVYYDTVDVPNYGKIGDRHGLGLGLGLSMNVNIKKNYGMRFFADYDITPPSISTSREYMHTFSLGATMAVYL